MSIPYLKALKNDYFGSVSLTVQLQNCAAPTLKVNRYISDMFLRHSLWQCEEVHDTIRYSEDLGCCMI